MPLKAGDTAAVEGFAHFMGSHLKNTLAAELVFVNRVEDFFTVAVADDDIRLGEGGGLLRIGLRHAARQHDDALRMQPFEAAHRLARFLIARAGYGAGVDEINVRLLFRRNDLKALCPKLLGQGLCFILIDLAAKGVKCSFHRGHSSISIPNSIRFQYNRNELKKQAKGNDFHSRGK